jgi:hypothetical protein
VGPRSAITWTRNRARLGHNSPMHGESSASGTSRDLTSNERELLDAMLSVDGLVGADMLRRQLTAASAEPSCTCGCGSIYLRVDRGASEGAEPFPEPVIVEGTVTREAGEPIGGLLLFHDDGWLHNLEVYSFTDEPLPLPTPSRTRLQLYR